MSAVARALYALSLFLYLVAVMLGAEFDAAAFVCVFVVGVLYLGEKVACLGEKIKDTRGSHRRPLWVVSASTPDRAKGE